MCFDKRFIGYFSDKSSLFKDMIIIMKFNLILNLSFLMIWYDYNSCTSTFDIAENTMDNFIKEQLFDLRRILIMFTIKTANIFVFHSSKL